MSGKLKRMCFSCLRSEYLFIYSEMHYQLVTDESIICIKRCVRITELSAHRDKINSFPVAYKFCECYPHIGRLCRHACCAMALRDRLAQLLLLFCRNASILFFDKVPGVLANNSIAIAEGWPGQLERFAAYVDHLVNYVDDFSTGFVGNAIGVASLPLMEDLKVRLLPASLFVLTPL